MEAALPSTLKLRYRCIERNNGVNNLPNCGSFELMRPFRIVRASIQILPLDRLTVHAQKRVERRECR
jgi:hypothetical protein